MTAPSRLPTRKESPAHARTLSDTLSYASTSSRNGSVSSTSSSVLPPSPSKATFGNSGTTLPSIRSLRSKFQSLSGGAKKGRVVSGPRVVGGPVRRDELPQEEPQSRGLTRTFGSYNLGHARRTSNLESPALPLSSPPLRRPSLDSALFQSPPTRITPPSASGIPRSSPPAVPPKSTATAGLYSRSPAETPLSQLRATRQPSLLRKPNPSVSRIPSLGTTGGASQIPPPRSVFSPTAQLQEPLLTFGEALETAPVVPLRTSSATPTELERFKDDFAFRRNSINTGVERERRASGLVEVAAISQPKEEDWLAGLGVRVDEGKELTEEPATTLEPKDATSALAPPILLARSSVSSLPQSVASTVDSFPPPIPSTTHGPQRQTSTSSPDPVAVAVFGEIPEPTDDILAMSASTAPTTPERRRRTIGEPETPDAYGATRIPIVENVAARFKDDSPEVLQVSQHLQQHSHRRSTSSSSGSSVPNHLDRPVSSNSHLSGHTFGKPHTTSPSFDPTPVLAPPSPTLVINTTSFDPTTTPFDAYSDPHRRSRSALDSVLSYGDPQIHRAGTIEPSSPVYVLSTDAFGGLYRSASARTSALRKEVRARKVRSASWDEEAVEEVLTPTARSFAEAGRGKRSEGVSSPLEDLIMGLGGRRQSVSSLWTGRGSMGAGEAEERVEQEQEEQVEPLVVAEQEEEEVDEDLTTRQPEFETSSPTVKLTTTDSKQLSVDEMEQEIARIESDLALGVPPVLQSNFDTSRSPISSPSGSPTLERSSLFPIPTSLERSSSLSSSINDITPRTARRWSMHEVELAYQRMKDMLGSSRSYAISEAGTFADDREMDDGEVEGAFERALRDASMGDLSFASESSAVEEDLEDDGDRATPMLSFNNLASSTGTSDSRGSTRLSPNSTLLPQPRNGNLLAESTKTRDSPGSSLGSQDGPQSASSPATSMGQSDPSHKSSSGSTGLYPSESNRRHTFNAPVDLNVFHDDVGHNRRGSDSTGGRISSTGNRRLRETLDAAPPFARMRTSDSSASVTYETGDEGWATPMTSRVSPSRASSRISVSAGQMRSEAGREWGRESQRLWLAEDAEDRPPSPPRSESVDRTLNGTSPRSARRNSHGGSLPSRRYTHTPDLSLDGRTSDFALRRGLKTNSTSGNETSTWFPATPERMSHRRPGVAPRFSTREGESEFENDPMSSSSANMAAIRGMDKLEIFFKYAAMKAALEKAELERDALMDALQESRAALNDVRGQRDTLSMEVRRDRGTARQLKKFLGSDTDTYGDQVEDLARSRHTWEMRARDTQEDLERAKDEREALRIMVLDGRDREELLERESLILATKLASTSSRRKPQARATAIATSEEGDTSPRRTLGSSSPPQRVASAASAVSRLHQLSSSPALTALPTRTHSRANSRTNSRTNSPAPNSPAPNSPAHSSDPPSPFRQSQNPQLSTPASKLAAAYRTRDPSLTSSPELNVASLGEFGSPLMHETLALGGKSSYGSIDSPIKPRGIPTLRGSISRLGLPRPPTFTSAIPSASTVAVTQAERLRRVSNTTVSSTKSSDFGDHLPPPGEREWNPSGSSAGTMPELDEKDERFLSDLSGPFQEQEV